MKKHKLLFISEDITLSQVVRLVELGKVLHNNYEIHFACSNSYPFVFNGCDFKHWTINCIGSEYMQKKLNRGAPLYDDKILLTYVEDELRLYEVIKPDFIISDFRWSVSISASHVKIPFAILINSYWNLDQLDFQLPIPDHPIRKILGYSASQFFFQSTFRFFFKFHLTSINKVRKKFNQRSFESIQELLTHGDYTLYPDTPSLSPLSSLKQNEIFIGPVVWSPNIEFEFKWSGDINHLPQVYYTPGSSGNKKLNRFILETLNILPVKTLFSTAGDDSAVYSKKIVAASLIAGDKACENSALVICNGGSSTAYQSLYQGTPVLCIPSNLDQQIASKMIANTGAGLVLNHDISQKSISFAILELLQNGAYKSRAEKVSAEFKLFDYKKIFPEWLRKRLT